MMQGFDLAALLLNHAFVSMLAHGLAMTFLVAIGAWLLAMTIGCGLLAIRLTDMRALESAVGFYVSYHRNVPTLVQLLLWYFGIASLLPDALQEWLGDHNAEAIFATIGLGLCQAAYFSEDLRSGLRSVGPGQWDAARALGFGYLGMFRLVLMPQAFGHALPALVNHTVSLFKNSSLAMAIGVVELTHAVREVENESFRTFEVYLVATLLYLLCTLALMTGGAMLGRRASAMGAR